MPHASSRALTLLLCCGALAGCNRERLAVQTTVALMAKAGPAMASHWDVDIAGQAMASQIMQLEGLLRVQPGEPALVEALQKAYLGYSYGWVEFAREQAMAAGDEWAVESRRRQALRLYRRAWSLGLYRLRQKHPGGAEALKAQPQRLRVWLQQHAQDAAHFDLFYRLAQAWGGIIHMGAGQPRYAAQLPSLHALAMHLARWQPAYDDAGPLLLLASLEASPARGELDAARQHFEQALKRTGGQARIVHLRYALGYAEAAGDVALKRRLLRQAAQPAVGVAPSLANALARARALWYLHPEHEAL
ncbi:MAG: TRAP transporter TatT component family protein [Polyangiales bacterium]